MSARKSETHLRRCRTSASGAPFFSPLPFFPPDFPPSYAARDRSIASLSAAHQRCAHSRSSTDAPGQSLARSALSARNVSIKSSALKLVRCTPANVSVATPLTPSAAMLASPSVGKALTQPTTGTSTPLCPTTTGSAISSSGSAYSPWASALELGDPASTTETLSAQKRLARSRSRSQRMGQTAKSAQKGDVRSKATASHVPSGTPLIEKAVPKIPQSHQTSQKRRRRARGIGVSTARSTISSVVLTLRPLLPSRASIAPHY